MDLALPGLLETQLLHIVFMASVSSQVIAGLFYFAILLKIMIFLFCFVLFF